MPALTATGFPATRSNGCHVLRHTFASVLLHDGAEVRALSDYLGHSDPGFTLRTYTHPMPAAHDGMRDTIDQAAAGREPGGPPSGETHIRAHSQDHGPGRPGGSR